MCQDNPSKRSAANRVPSGDRSWAESTLSGRLFVKEIAAKNNTAAAWWNVFVLDVDGMREESHSIKAQGVLRVLLLNFQSKYETRSIAISANLSLRARVGCSAPCVISRQRVVFYSIWTQLIGRSRSTFGFVATHTASRWTSLVSPGCRVHAKP